MYQILFPTDFSGASINAINHTIAFAKLTEAKIFLLHVQHPLIFPEDVPLPLHEEVMEKFYKDIPEELLQIQKVLLQEGISSEIINRYGLLIEEMENLCSTYNINMVITGTDNDAFNTIFGTNSLAMVEKMNCPVVVIPKDAKYKLPQRILYATEFLEEDIEKLNRVKFIADKVQAKIFIAHVNTDTKHYYDDADKQHHFAQMIEGTENENGYFYTTIHNENVTDGILGYIEKAEIDLICMSTKKKNFLEKLFKGSKTQKMASITPIPLIVYHI